MENIINNKKIILKKIQQAHTNSNFSSLPYPKLVAVSKKTDKKDGNLKENQKSEENQSKSNEN